MGKARTLFAVLLLPALAACKSASDIRSEISPGGGATKPVSAPLTTRAALPPEACTREGAWVFFEAFVRHPHVREAHSRVDLLVGAQPGADNFRIALVDNRWVYADPARSEAQFPRVRLTGSRDGDLFRVEYAAAEFGPDDEVLKSLGPTGRYVFEFRDGCWTLTHAEP